MALVQYSKEVTDFIKSMSSMVSDGKDTWMFFPYWLREDSEGVFEQVSFDQLPESFKQIVKDIRNGDTLKGKESF